MRAHGLLSGIAIALGFIWREKKKKKRQNDRPTTKQLRCLSPSILLSESKAVVLSLGQISCISDIYIMTHNSSKITVMRLQ